MKFVLSLDCPLGSSLLFRFLRLANCAMLLFAQLFHQLVVEEFSFNSQMRLRKELVCSMSRLVDFATFRTLS